MKFTFSKGGSTGAEKALNATMDFQRLSGLAVLSLLSYIRDMVWTGIEALNEHMELQRHYVAKKVPAYETLLLVIQSLLRCPLKEKLEHVWKDRFFCAEYERPALLQAAMRWAALTDGAAHPLYAGLVDPALPETITPYSVNQALQDERIWTLLKTRTIQTNETSRAVIWLWPAHLIAIKNPDAAISLFDIGASAGLNLIGDRLDAPWTDQYGKPLLAGALPSRVVQRSGFDRNPLDANRLEDALWLLACVWPGQTDRIERLHSAIKAFGQWSSSETPPSIEKCTASEIPARISVKGSHAIAYQSLMRDYLDPEERTHYETGMREWLSKSPGRYVWAELEIVDHDVPPEISTALAVHVFRQGAVQSFSLARCHPHPRRLVVDDEQVTAFLEGLT